MPEIREALVTVYAPKEELDKLFDALRPAKVNYVMLNAAGIIASYDTDLEYQTKSASLSGDGIGEALYRNLSSAARVLVVHKGLLARSDPEVNGWIRALTAGHIPFDEVKLSELTAELLAEKEVVVLPDAKMLGDSQAALLDGFVQGGGILVATGETGLYTQTYQPRAEQALRCIGMKNVKEKQHDHASAVFYAAGDSRLPACQAAPQIAFGPDYLLAEYEAGAEMLLPMIPEHPFGPPERCYYTEISNEPGVVMHTTPVQIGTDADGIALYADQTSAATTWINFSYQGAFVLMGLLFFVLFAFFNDIEAHMPTVHDALQERKRAECEAQGIEYIPAQELERMEKEAQKAEAEENRIRELKEYCAKHGKDFDTENQKVFDKRAKKAAKKAARKARKK